MTWDDYQRKVAEIFTQFGAIATVESKVKGARGTHTIDVFVEIEIHSIKSKWICECKLWKKPVEKSAVLTFHSIVNDVGADKGLFFSESGFQSGAVSVTKNTNIMLTSLDEFTTDVREEISKFSLLSLLSRIGMIRSIAKKAWLDENYNPRFHKTIKFDKCVYLDGFLLMLTPKIQDALDNNYPIHLSSYASSKSVKCSNFEELDSHLRKDFAIIENDVEEIIMALKDLQLNISKDRQLFINSAKELISYAQNCIYNSPTETDLLTIASLMKKVGSTSSSLKDSSSGAIKEQLSLTMRHLIYNLYPHFLKEKDSIDEWNISLRELKSHLRKLKNIDVT